MGVRNWVKFLVLSVLLFAFVLIIIYKSEIWKAITDFPLDWVISFLVGAGVMFLANFKFARRRKKSDNGTV